MEGSAMGAPAAIANAMTVDVEDYFQVQALSGVIARADWDAIACRVEDNVARLLDRFAAADVRGIFHPRLDRRAPSGDGAADRRRRARTREPRL